MAFPKVSGHSPLPDAAGAARFGAGFLAAAFGEAAAAFGGRPRPFLAPFSSFAGSATGAAFAGFSAFLGEAFGAGASALAA